MKLGLIVKQGTEEEVREEFEVLKNKARAGYKDKVEIKENDFVIRTTDLRVTFSFDTCLSECAIYQIFE